MRLILTLVLSLCACTGTYQIGSYVPLNPNYTIESAGYVPGEPTIIYEQRGGKMWEYLVTLSNTSEGVSIECKQRKLPTWNFRPCTRRAIKDLISYEIKNINLP